MPGVKNPMCNAFPRIGNCCHYHHHNCHHHHRNCCHYHGNFPHHPNQDHLNHKCSGAYIVACLGHFQQARGKLRLKCIIKLIISNRHHHPCPTFLVKIVPKLPCRDLTMFKLATLFIAGFRVSFFHRQPLLFYGPEKSLFL